jgi:hypothetical protein
MNTQAQERRDVAKPYDSPVEALSVASERQPDRLLGRVWRARPLWLGLAALGCAAYGQQMVAEQEAIVPAIRWYALGILVLFVAWLGTYRNKTCLPRMDDGPWTMDDGGPSTLPAADERAGSADNEPPSASEAIVHPSQAQDPSSIVHRPSSIVLSYGLGIIAVGLNLYSAAQLRGDYHSVVGSLGWVASLVLLLAAAVGVGRGRSEASGSPLAAEQGLEAQDVEDRTALKLPRRLEIAILLGIVVLGLAFRLYRLGDVTAGMNVDEGGFGQVARSILDGDRVSPFAIWWISQENFSFWAIALAMQVFGTDLFGLRMFSVLAGTLMIVPTYLLTRLWFGTRAAIIAGVLVAVMEVSVHTSRLALNNIPIPLCLATGLYFLFRGLRSRRPLDFVLAGYALMLSLYFYYAGRLTPLLLAAVLGYLFLLVPLLRLPGAYRRVRHGAPDLPWVSALRRAVAAQAGELVGTLRHYGVQLLFLAAACLAFASPWVVFFVNHQQDMTGHTNEKMIFTYPDRGTAIYGVNHDPLYLGLRLPRGDDIYPVLPVALEQTPLSVQLSGDGYWVRVLWRQLTTTLGMFTHRGEGGGGFYPFNGAPVVMPLESVLLVLGLAWALWRWRDTRMAVLSLWFWPTIIAGNVLTVDPPYFERLPGIIPALAILMALPLNKLAAEYVYVMRNAECGMRNDDMNEMVFRIPHSSRPGPERGGDRRAAGISCCAERQRLFCEIYAELAGPGVRRPGGADPPAERGRVGAGATHSTVLRPGRQLYRLGAEHQPVYQLRYRGLRYGEPGERPAGAGQAQPRPGVLDLGVQRALPPDAPDVLPGRGGGQVRVR